MKVEPRMFNNEKGATSSPDVADLNSGVIGSCGYKEDDTEQEWDSEGWSGVEEALARASLRHSIKAEKSPSRDFSRGQGLPVQDMGLSGQGSMDRFMPLTLGQTTLTEATIGGFKLDMRSLAEQAAEVIPLPAVALPVIFQDKELNFGHHFFQGLEVLCGRDFIVNAVSIPKYSHSESETLGPIVQKLCSEGHKSSDTVLATLVKRVLSSTFDIQHDASTSAGFRTFTVKSNMYGFPYIEVGMQCKEADLKMWLQSAYGKYRMLWFNAFKSSGIPAFAMEGVQDRYTGLTQRTGASSSSDDAESRSGACAHYRSKHEKKHRTRDHSVAPRASKSKELVRRKTFF